MDIFLGARLKIERANQHICDLNNLINSYVKSYIHSDLYGFFLEYDSDCRQYVLDIRIEPVPKEAALIFGDAVHNLRTALDVAATTITGRLKTTTKYTKFPFGNSRDELVSAVNGGLKKTMPDHIIDVILNDIRPYKGGNDSLCAVHDLDIDDKHFTILPVIFMRGLRSVKLSCGLVNIDAVWVGTSTAFPNMKSKCTLPGEPKPKLHIYNKGEPSCEVRIGGVYAPSNQPIIPTLHQFAEIVSGCVDNLEKAMLTV